MLLDKLLNIIEVNLPAASAMGEDKIGLQVQSGKKEVNKILVTLEVNDAVLKEAGKYNCDCIITFHPLIYNPLKFIKDDDRTGSLCSGLIKKSISLISVHTNFDAYSEGTSKIFASRLGLKVIDFLQPDKNFENRGMGVIAVSEKPISPEGLLKRIYKICKSPIRYSIKKDLRKLDKIVIVGGSGTAFMDNAIKSGASAFITADITYHRFHEANGKLMLIDPGHYEMEQFVPEGIALLLKEKLSKTDYKSIHISNTLTNPVRYYPKTEKYLTLQKNNLLYNHMVV